MKIGQGRILEIRQQEGQPRQAVAVLEDLPHPAAGQYLQVYREKDTDQPAGITLFPVWGGESAPEEIPLSCLAGIPEHWSPGDRLNLYGPLGRGFNLPNQTSKLALAALGDTSPFLLPLANEVIAMAGEVALFTDGDFPQLPTQLEVNPLSDLPEAAGWADFLAVAARGAELDHDFRLSIRLTHPNCPAQVMAIGQFPCAGLGECGGCAIKNSGRQIIYACQNGPVFDWKER